MIETIIVSSLVLIIIVLLCIPQAKHSKYNCPLCGDVLYSASGIMSHIKKKHDDI